MKIVLASASARRREILSMVCSDFDIRVANADESYNGENVYEWIQALATKKAMGVEAQQGELVIGADTIVYHNGALLGKPKSRAEAISMLKSMSSASHEVITGICVLYNGKAYTAYEKTIVHVRELTDSEIEKYVDTCEPYDKAGAYGIQEMAGAFIKKIDGDFFNVVGLPLCRLCELIKEKLGVSLI